MRVLNVTTYLQHGGGIESFLLNFYSGLTAPDLTHELCYCETEPGSLLPEFEKLGIRVWGCASQLNYRAFMKRFRAALRSRPRFDVVHCHMGNHAGPVLAVARELGVPVRLAHYHNTHPGHKNDFLRRLYERWMRRMVLREATRIIGCAWASLKYWYHDCWDRDPRMTVLRYGVPAQAFAAGGAREEVRREFGIAPDAPVVGHVGGFRWQKNHEGLLNAARHMAERRPDMRLLIVGDGTLRPQIEAQIARDRLERTVVLAGMRRDVPRMLSAMDILTLPSVREGHPVTLIEGQMAGLPIVASNIPSAYEAVAPVFHEYLRDPHDAPGLAEAMIALADRVRREPQLKDQARAFGNLFSVEASCQAMLAAWGYPGAVAPPDPCAWAGPSARRA